MPDLVWLKCMHASVTSFGETHASPRQHHLGLLELAAACGVRGMNDACIVVRYDLDEMNERSSSHCEQI